MINQILSTDIGFSKDLSEIIQANEFSWPFHHGHFFDYLIQSAKEKGCSILDLSSIWKVRDEPVAALLLTAITDAYGNSHLSFGEGSASLLTKPEFVRNTNYNAVCKNIIKYIDKHRNELKNVSFEFIDTLNNGSISALTEHLIKLGAKARPTLVSSIDLTLDNHLIKSRLRKRYKHYINWGQKNLSIRVHDRHGISLADVEVFRELHENVSGRATRSHESWLIRYQMVCDGVAFMLSVHERETPISFSFFLQDGLSAYYMSSASIREKFDKPIMHSSIWEALSYSKKIGLKNFIVGDTHPHLFEDALDKNKQLQIANFKRGFGGDTRLVLNVFS